MKKLALVLVVVSALAVAWPAAGVTGQTSGCSATSAVTASQIVPETAPVCTFELICDSLISPCLFGVTLDVNGTGAVSGTMTAQTAFGTPGTVRFIDLLTGDPATDPQCSANFQCHFASFQDAYTVLQITPGFSGGGVAKVGCVGGGLAAVETVGCSVVQL